MNRVDDEKVRFYLRHRELIDEWAALAGMATQVAHRFCLSCAGDLAQLATDLGGDVRCGTFEEVLRYPKVLLYRPAWSRGDTVPEFGIGLEWDRYGVSFAGPSRPYTELWHKLDAPEREEVRSAVVERVRPLLRPNGYTAGQWSRAYRYEPAPSGEYWEDLSPMRQRIVQSVRDGWELFARIVDEAVAASAARAAP